jgi:hypothetical protein
MKRALQVFSVVAAFALASCATVKQAGQGSLAFLQKTSSATGSKVSKLSEMAVNTIRPPGVKIVEVREKDLKKLPTGHEKALAFENTRKRGFWFFNGPVDFTEPTLPLPGGETDGSLLPPKTP